MRTLLRSIALLLLLAGCGGKPQAIFPPTSTPIVWPPPPERARVAYIGRLATSADLKRKPGGLEAIGGAIFGKKGERAMLTPYSVCTDGGDRIFVADSNAQCVHVFDLKTRKYAAWTPRKPIRFAQPVGVAYEPSLKRLYVSDSVGATVHMFDGQGKYLGQTIAGLFQRPTGIFYDRNTRRLFVTDTIAHNVTICAPNGEPITKFGTRGQRLGEFNFPNAVTVDSAGRIYVCDALNFRIQQFDPDLRVLRQIGKQGDMPGYFAAPKAVACDSQNHLYVVDAQFEAVQIFDAAGQLLLNFGEEGHKPGQFWLPTGIFIDRSDRIWVADDYNRRVQLLQYLPEVMQR